MGQSLSELELDPGSFLPVSVQLTEQMKGLIRRGVLATGTRLPSVRDLAGSLRVNRNTVVRSLGDLERQGYVKTHHGKGAFVAGELPDGRHAADLEALVEQTLRAAVDRGLDAEAIGLALLTARRGASPPVAPVRLLFVECTGSLVRRYRRNLEASLPAVVDVLRIDELERRHGEPGFLERYALVMTTAFHAEEVDSLLVSDRTPVLALLPAASMDTLFRLLQLPAGTPVGVIGDDHEAVENLRRSLERSGLNRLNLLGAALDDGAAVTGVLERARLVVTLSDCADELRAVAPGVELVVEDGRLDRHDLELVRRLLAETAPD
ncbi:MAG TPA: GntR family transcriptional regulator [Candidatus Eisenbacteria bacterium]|nr:GntR family transcriptional regulator [Candidatus Eisenbacteria bacterium]